MRDESLAKIWLITMPTMGVGVVICALCVPEEAALWLGKLSPGCLFHRITGLSCPGCGGTRAMQALLRGDWATAWGLNMFLWVSLLLLAEEYVRLALRQWWKRDTISRAGWYGAMLRLYAIAVVLWFILRNVFGV